MVVDSDILIDFFRDFVKAKEFLLYTEAVRVSRVTVMEVIIGVKTRQAAIKALKQLDALGVKVIEVDDRISAKAGDTFQELWHRHGVGILDCFVVATALVAGEKLATRNEKYFKYIPGLDLIVPY